MRKCARQEGTPARDVSAPIIMYDGDQNYPAWMDVERDRFETLCNVAADISAAPCTRAIGRFGNMCYSREYEVVLLVGLTELKAKICWFDSTTGKEDSTNAKIVYKGTSLTSCVGPRETGSTPPPRYEDFGSGS